MRFPDIESSRCWAIALPALRAIAAGHVEPAPERWAARSAARPAGNGVTIIPVMGVITQRSSYFGTSIDMLRTSLRAALADAETQAIVLQFESPGGVVYGVDEMATEIRAARAVKPIVAAVDPVAASAAYYLAAQASSIVVTPSGEAGSIGVYTMHQDWSRALDQMGITITLISAGEGKVDGNMFEPLPDAVRAEMEADIGRYYAMFTKAAARGRGVSVETVRSEWQAKMYGAEDAVRVGLADAVGTIEDAVRLAARAGRERRSTAASVDREVEARRRLRARGPIAS